MSVERRVQRLEPCQWPIHECDPRPGFRCDGCNGDGRRWVTEGTLVAVESPFETFVAGDGQLSIRGRKDLFALVPEDGAT